MDIKADDVLNVDIDPALLLRYDFEQLNLDSIPTDILDQIPDESLKNEDKIDVKKNCLLKDSKGNESTTPNCFEIKTENTSADEDKFYDAQIKDETSSEYLEIKKDINGNDESVSEENLNKLFDQLDLSDSDNEEIDDANHLQERGGPERSSKSKRASRRKDANNLWCKTGSYDKGQFDSERLKFLSGSCQVQYDNNVVPNNYAIYNSQTTINGGIEHTFNALSQESYFEDTRASSVSSPESGYDSSSAHSITGSPPPVLFTSSLNLDFIPETAEDQNLLDFLIENADSALTVENLADNIDDKDAKGKINEIKKFLLEDIPIPSALRGSCNVVATSHRLLDAVPFPNQSTVFNTSDVESSPVSNTSAEASSPISNTSTVALSPVSNTSAVESSPLSNSSKVKSSPNSNSPEVKSSAISNSSEVKSLPVSCNIILKNVEKSKKIVPLLKDNAKGTLRKFLSTEEYYDASRRIYDKIREDEAQGKDISAIYVEDEMEKDSKNRTNLHNAVLNGKIEDIFSIVEIHKQYDLPFAAINIRDKNNKTALDYAIQNQMTLVADYLRENTACQSVNLEK